MNLATSVLFLNIFVLVQLIYDRNDYILIMGFKLNIKWLIFDITSSNYFILIETNLIGCIIYSLSSHTYTVYI